MQGAMKTFAIDERSVSGYIVSLHHLTRLTAVSQTSRTRARAPSASNPDAEAVLCSKPPRTQPFANGRGQECAPETPQSDSGEATLESLLADK